MTRAQDPRPALARDLPESEFVRWYWTKDELAEAARAWGLRATGSKELLASRIAAALAGRAFAEPAPARRAAGPQLRAPIAGDTRIPAGQRCSQVVRAWMEEQLGGGFHFDAAMRAFFAESDGTSTMRDALAHWAETRGAGPRPIDAQFEFNRFTRAWTAAVPDGSREELLAAWWDYRRRPRDERGSAARVPQGVEASGDLPGRDAQPAEAFPVEHRREG